MKFVVRTLAFLVGMNSTIVRTAYAEGSASPDFDFSNTMSGKISIAIVSAVLSLLVGYILYYIKDRKEGRKRLSYDIEFRKGMLGIEERISRDLVIAYKGRPANDINYVRCEILNSGTSIVRDQYLRFEFPSGIEVLDWSVDPVPPKELGFSAAPERDDGINERSFTFKNFEVQKKVSLHFVLSGKYAGATQVHGFNATEEVQVVPGNVGAATDDRRLLERFLLIYLLTFFVPRALGGVPTFGGIANSIFYTVIAIISLPLIPSVARVLASALTSISRQRISNITVGNVDSGMVVVGGETAQLSGEIAPKSGPKPKSS